jgi:4-hydroxy-tetrahydrodipicolinate reductase
MTIYGSIVVQHHADNIHQKVEGHWTSLLFSFYGGQMNIALIGYGKMGHEIERCAVERRHAVSQKFSSRSPVSPSLLAGSDCCIDFSTPLCLDANLSSALSAGVPMIIGTTGWENQLRSVQEKTGQAGGSVLYASNFSVGANIMFRLTELAAGMFNRFEQYDISIHETHHAMKKDAPSGTALTLASKVLLHVDRKKRMTTDHASGSELFISSSRIGTVAGEHTVRFNSPADDICISHTAHDRSGFALGAVLAAEWIVDKKGFFTFEEFLWDHADLP